MIIYIFAIIIFLRVYILTVNKSSTIFFFPRSKAGLISILKGKLGRFSTEATRGARVGDRRAKYFEKLKAKKRIKIKIPARDYGKSFFGNYEYPGNFSFSSFDPIFIRFFQPSRRVSYPRSFLSR